MRMRMTRAGWGRGVLGAVTAAAAAGTAGLVGAAPATAATGPQVAAIAMAGAHAGVRPAGRDLLVNCAERNLQGAIDSAPAGGELEVTGRCTGNFTIDKDLLLVGEGAGAVLDGDGTGTGTTLSIGSARVLLINMTITGGNTSGAGGGIYNRGIVILGGSTVTGNTAGSDGGGIFNDKGVVDLSSSSVTGNTAGFDGGGIFDEAGGTVRLTGSTVTGNTPDNCFPSVPGCTG